MVSEKELIGYRKTVQNIINKYLPEDKRFSVEDFSEEGLYYITSLFLEKDPDKRKEIYKEIEEKRKEAEIRLQKAEHNFLELNNEIMERKEEYDKIFSTIRELNSLSNDVNIDLDLDASLSQF